MIHDLHITYVYIGESCLVVTVVKGRGITAASWVPGSEQLNNLNNFLLFINSKILREGMCNGYVYTHMYIESLFSCSGCSQKRVKWQIFAAGGVQLNTGTTFVYIY